MDKKEEVVMSESERQEKKLRDAQAARKRKKRVKSLVGWLIVILIVALVLFWFLKMKKDSDAKIAALQNSSTNIEYTVTRSKYVKSIDISGNVVAYDKQEANFRSSGAVTGVFVKVGDSVTKGQVLATIDDSSQQSNLQDIENQIAEAKISGSTRQLELLELKKKNAEEQLSYTTLTANFDGIVSKVSIAENDYVSAGTTVITVIDISRLKTTVEIDEVDMQYIEDGLTATLSFDSLPGQSVPAYVTYIPMEGRYTSSGIGVVDVELTIDNPPSGLRTGYTFTGSIDMEQDVEMLLVPSSSVSTERGGKTYVTVKKADGSTERRNVTVSYLGEGYSQVLSGLKEGETVTYRASSSEGSGFSIGGF